MSELLPAAYPTEPDPIDLDDLRPTLLPGDCDCGHRELDHEDGGRCGPCGDRAPCFEYDPDGEDT